MLPQQVYSMWNVTKLHVVFHFSVFLIREGFQKLWWNQTDSIFILNLTRLGSEVFSLKWCWVWLNVYCRYWFLKNSFEKDINTKRAQAGAVPLMCFKSFICIQLPKYTHTARTVVSFLHIESPDPPCPHIPFLATLLSDVTFHVKQS